MENLRAGYRAPRRESWSSGCRPQGVPTLIIHSCLARQYLWPATRVKGPRQYLACHSSARQYLGLPVA